MFEIVHIRRFSSCCGCHKRKRRNSRTPGLIVNWIVVSSKRTTIEYTACSVAFKLYSRVNFKTNWKHRFSCAFYIMQNNFKDLICNITYVQLHSIEPDFFLPWNSEKVKFNGILIERAFWSNIDKKKLIFREIYPKFLYLVSKWAYFTK